MSEVFRPYERLVEITILGKTFLVPERNSLLRAFQFISPETIPYGRFCWNQECQYCRVDCQLSDDDQARPILSCKFIVSEGMNISNLAPELVGCLRTENSGRRTSSGRPPAAVRGRRCHSYGKRQLGPVERRLPTGAARPEIAQNRGPEAVAILEQFGACGRGGAADRRFTAAATKFGSCLGISPRVLATELAARPVSVIWVMATGTNWPNGDEVWRMC